MLDDSVYLMRDAIRFMKPGEPLGGFLTVANLMIPVEGNLLCQHLEMIP